MTLPIALTLLLSPLLIAQSASSRDPATPVATNDPLDAASTASRGVVPPEFFVQVIVGKPDVVQPIAYTLDDRGRLRILENTNYPKSPGKPKSMANAPSKSAACFGTRRLSAPRESQRNKPSDGAMRRLTDLLGVGLLRAVE